MKIFFFLLVEKKFSDIEKFLSVAKMASTVYETETCDGDGDVKELGRDRQLPSPFPPKVYITKRF